MPRKARRTKISELVVSNIRVAELLGATAMQPDGWFLLVRSKLGGIRYWKVTNDALKDGDDPTNRPVRR